MRNSYLSPEESVVQNYEAQLSGKSDADLKELIRTNGRLYNTFMEEAETNIDVSKVKVVGGTDDEKRDKLSGTIAERQAAMNLLKDREVKEDADRANKDALNAIRTRGPRTFTPEQVTALVRENQSGSPDAQNILDYRDEVVNFVQNIAGSGRTVGPDTFKQMLAQRAAFETSLLPSNYLLRDPLNVIDATKTMQTGTGLTGQTGGTGFLSFPPLQQDTEYLSRRATSVYAFLATRAMELPANMQGAYRYSAESAPSGDKPKARPQAGALSERKYSTVIRTTNLSAMGQMVPVAVEEFLDVPMFMNFLNTVMREDLLLEVDNDLINGDGNNDKVKGLANLDDITTTPMPGGAGDPGFGVTQIHSDIIERVFAVGNAYADFVLLNPVNWHQAITQRDSQDRLLVGNTVDATNKRMFGLPVLLNTALAAGTTLVGASNKCQLVTQGNIRVETTNSHDDGFGKLVDAVRMWTRIGLVNRRGTAFAKTTGWMVKKDS